ncbi:LysR family transcriptional regulator [Pectobacterium atrosepticum]|nr:LysR family transcriptional regulator [Pectobacterium atrosepticum]
MHSSEIRYFLVVATTGSLSAASQHLFVAVSAISRQIQRLEERIGVPLFERHARGMVLNDAGRILENHVRKSMMDMDAAVAEIQGLKASRRALLRIGCTEGMAFDLLPTLFARFRQHDPDTTFALKVDSAMQVSQMIRNGEVDIAL